MTAQHDLDRTLGPWFGAEAVPAPPPELLDRILDSTRGGRPRPSLVANIGSHWIDGGSTNGVRSGALRLRPALVIALVALLVLALVGGAVLVGSRLTPRLPKGHVYRNELVGAPNLPTPMAHPLVVPLIDGRVLVIHNDSGQTTAAIIYDPSSGASVPAGPMRSADHYAGEAVRLRDGRVLIIGDGVNQVFDPMTMGFTALGPTVTPRSGGSATLLLDGRVLIAGGMPPGGNPGVDPALQSAELFDPATMTSLPTGSILTPTGGGPMVTLPDGRVFMATDPWAEVYDPKTGAFDAASTTSSGGGGRPVVLPDGRVVVFGNSGLQTSGYAAIWDPSTQTFATLFGGPEPVFGATLLDDGRILMTGGRNASWSSIFDPMTGVTMPAPVPKAWRPTASRLNDGRVLIVGGLVDGTVRPGPSGGGEMAPAVPTVQIFQ